MGTDIDILPRNDDLDLLIAKAILSKGGMFTATALEITHHLDFQPQNAREACKVLMHVQRRLREGLTSRRFVKLPLEPGQHYRSWGVTAAYVLQKKQLRILCGLRQTPVSVRNSDTTLTSEDNSLLDEVEENRDTEENCGLENTVLSDSENRNTLYESCSAARCRGWQNPIRPVDNNTETERQPDSLVHTVIVDEHTPGSETVLNVSEDGNTLFESSSSARCRGWQNPIHTASDNTETERKPDGSLQTLHTVDVQDVGLEDETEENVSENRSMLCESSSSARCRVWQKQNHEASNSTEQEGTSGRLVQTAHVDEPSLESEDALNVSWYGSFRCVHEPSSDRENTARVSDDRNLLRVHEPSSESGNTLHVSWYRNLPCLHQPSLESENNLRVPGIRTTLCESSSAARCHERQSAIQPACNNTVNSIDVHEPRLDPETGELSGGEKDENGNWQMQPSCSSGQASCGSARTRSINRNGQKWADQICQDAHFEEMSCTSARTRRLDKNARTQADLRNETTAFDNSSSFERSGSRNNESERTPADRLNSQDVAYSEVDSCHSSHPSFSRTDRRKTVSESSTDSSPQLSRSQSSESVYSLTSDSTTSSSHLTDFNIKLKRCPSVDSVISDSSQTDSGDSASDSEDEWHKTDRSSTMSRLSDQECRERQASNELFAVDAVQAELLSRTRWTGFGNLLEVLQQDAAERGNQSAVGPAEYVYEIVDGSLPDNHKASNEECAPLSSQLEDDCWQILAEFLQMPPRQGTDMSYETAADDNQPHGNEIRFVCNEAGGEQSDSGSRNEVTTSSHCVKSTATTDETKQHVSHSSYSFAMPSHKDASVNSESGGLLSTSSESDVSNYGTRKQTDDTVSTSNSDLSDTESNIRAESSDSSTEQSEGRNTDSVPNKSSHKRKRRPPPLKVVRFRIGRREVRPKGPFIPEPDTEGSEHSEADKTPVAKSFRNSAAYRSSSDTDQGSSRDESGLLSFLRFADESQMASSWLEQHSDSALSPDIFSAGRPSPTFPFSFDGQARKSYFAFPDIETWPVQSIAFLDQTTTVSTKSASPGKSLEASTSVRSPLLSPFSSPDGRDLACSPTLPVDQR